MPNHDKLLALYEDLIASGIGCTMWEKPTIRRLYLDTPQNIKAYFQLEPHKDPAQCSLNGIPFYLEFEPTNEVLQKHIDAAYAEAREGAKDYVIKLFNEACIRVERKTG